MARQVTIDHAAIVQMWASGKLIREIMYEIHCSESTVRRALTKAGYKMTPSPQPAKEYKPAADRRRPIYPEEIIQYRERLKIGSIVHLPSLDEKSRCPEGGRYAVIAKYPTFFIAAKGQCERHELYATMLINKRIKESLQC